MAIDTRMFALYRAPTEDYGPVFGELERSISEAPDEVALELDADGGWNTAA